MNYLAQLQGLHCEACKKITEKRIGKHVGVTYVSTDISRQEVTIKSDMPLTVQAIIELLKDTQYKISNLKEV